MANKAKRKQEPCCPVCNGPRDADGSRIHDENCPAANEGLNELRQDWEDGLKPLAVMAWKSGVVLVILQEKNRRATYHCHRYSGYAERGTSPWKGRGSGWTTCGRGSTISGND